tara:strand:- start:51 stop:527 length:477 start_codon:yes stop_codon:yes gene_type:complete
MSRLESMRRRLSAQIDGLNWAATQISGLKGDVLEMGLGNGRTYDHLRQEIPNRRIWVIDREMRAHPSCVPPDVDFLRGEAEDILVDMAARGVKLALAHCDFGIGVSDKDAEVGARIGRLVAPLMVPGGLIVSQPPMVGFTPIDGPDSVAPGRYLFYRA